MNANAKASLTAAPLSCPVVLIPLTDTYHIRRWFNGDNHARAIRAAVNALKEETPCAMCGNLYPAPAMQFDHITPADKYRTRAGALVHLADMVKGGRYGYRTILAEIAKCRLVCANCHAIHTHTVQRAR
jgi:hypothetical protein